MRTLFTSLKRPDKSLETGKKASLFRCPLNLAENLVTMTILYGKLRRAILETHKARCKISKRRKSIRRHCRWTLAVSPIIELPSRDSRSASNPWTGYKSGEKKERMETYKGGERNKESRGPRNNGKAETLNGKKNERKEQETLQRRNGKKKRENKEEKWQEKS